MSIISYMSILSLKAKSNIKASIKTLDRQLTCQSQILLSFRFVEMKIKNFFFSAS